MIFKTCFYIFAIVCAGQCNPLIPTQTSTVCDTTPNLLGLGLGLGPLSMNLLPNLPYGLPINPVIPSSTTVCESSNVGLPAPLPIGLADWQTNIGLNYYPLPIPVQSGIPMSSTTLCESTPNIIGIPPYGLIGGLQRPYGPFGPYGPIIGGMPALV